MIESYEKRGSSVRVERNGRATSTIVAREHGRAIRDRGRFRAESLGERPLALAPDVAGTTELARRIASLGGGGVAVERVAVVAGIVEHSLTSGDATTSWSEEVARAHMSLVNQTRSLRVAIDLGGERVSELSLDAAVEAAKALDAAEPAQASFDGLIELAPIVSAALWIFVARHPALFLDSRLQIAQSTHPSWPLDGAGKTIEQHPLTDATPPDLFRPSFRVAPTPAWFHLRASLRGVRRLRRSAGVRVVALHGPFRLTRTSISAGVLAVSGDESFAMLFELPRETLADSIVRISRRATWFPFEAGAWGSNTLIAGATLTPQ